jgi:hypothetical protein
LNIEPSPSSHWEWEVLSKIEVETALDLYSTLS